MISKAPTRDPHRADLVLINPPTTRDIAREAIAAVRAAEKASRA